MGHHNFLGWMSYTSRIGCLFVFRYHVLYFAYGISCFSYFLFYTSRMGCLFVFHYHVLYYGINISRLQKLCLDNLCSLSLSTLYMPIYEVYMPHALYMPIYEVCSDLD